MYQAPDSIPDYTHLAFWIAVKPPGLVVALTHGAIISAIRILHLSAACEIAAGADDAFQVFEYMQISCCHVESFCD